ncbi:glycoside hydrolase family 108 protein [Allopusillimonas ginsengisoli]|uniref:glycoside hydrolase family 108 protein n=1 Tax=Allopusillimonas ginsengisoli TaxID=453575 RepID=UPI00314550BA
MIIELLKRIFAAPVAAQTLPVSPPAPGTTVTFTTAFERLIGHEGGYSNHSDDPGGETMWGITKRVAQENGYTGSMRELTREQAKAIYKTQYWDRARCDEYDGAIAFQVFDAAVNHGIGNAIRFLQRAAGVADDGAMGPVTMEAIKSMSVTDVLARFNAARLTFYTNLSTWPSFGKGWARRIAGNLNYVADDS